MTLFSMSNEARALSFVTTLRMLQIWPSLRAMVGCPCGRLKEVTSLEYCLMIGRLLLENGSGPASLTGEELQNVSLDFCPNWLDGIFIGETKTSYMVDRTLASDSKSVSRISSASLEELGGGDWAALSALIDIVGPGGRNILMTILWVGKRDSFSNCDPNTCVCRLVAPVACRIKSWSDRSVQRQYCRINCTRWKHRFGLRPCGLSSIFFHGGLGCCFWYGLKCKTTLWGRSNDLTHTFFVLSLCGINSSLWRTDTFNQFDLPVKVGAATLLRTIASCKLHDSWDGSLFCPALCCRKIFDALSPVHPVFLGGSFIICWHAPYRLRQ